MKKSWSHREVCLGRVGSGRNFRVLSSAEPAFAAERLAIVAALERSHFWFVARRGLIERLLRRFSPPSGTMAIDVGCGTGSFADGLARSGFRVLALGVRPEGLRRLRETGSPAWAAMGLCTDLPVAAGAADIVLTFDVLEHTDDEVSLGEIARVLRPGGIVVITVPAMPRFHGLRTAPRPGRWTETAGAWLSKGRARTDGLAPDPLNDCKCGICRSTAG